MQPTKSTTDLEMIKTGFHALSDGLRLKILELLRSHELCVCEICEKLQVSQSKLSFHLKILREANLVFARQEGRWIYYSLNATQFLELEKYLAQYRQFSSFLPSILCE